MNSKKKPGAGSGLLRLPPLDDEGRIRVVVETPKGSRAKFTYDPALGLFEFSRPLAAGVVYPFDFGFVPGTRADDGDPVDALVLHEEPGYPGVMIACRPVGVVEVEQDHEETGKRIRNDRLVLVPADDQDAAARNTGGALTTRRKRELEEFFRSATLFEGKRVKLLGWGSARLAVDLIRAARTGRGGAKRRRR